MKLHGHTTDNTMGNTNEMIRNNYGKCSGNTYEMIIKLQNSPHNETFPICSDEVDFAHECVRKLNKTASLYRVRHGYDISKTVSLKHDGDFDISVYQKFPEEEMKLLVNYKITDLYASLDFMKKEQITDKPKVNLRFVLNKRGMLSFKVREFNSYLFRLKFLSTKQFI